MDYSLIISLVTFIAAIKISITSNVKPLLATFIAVILPYCVSSFTKWIYVSANNLPVIENVSSLSSIVSLFCQFLFTYAIFYKLQYEEAYVSWLLWVGGGTIGTIFIIPYIIHLFVG